MITRGEPYDKKNWKWKKFKLQINSFLKKLPYIHNIIQTIWKKFNNIAINRRYVKTLSNVSSDFNFDDIYWVDTKKIKYSSIKEFFTTKYSGKILGGDWDNLEKLFDKLDVFIAFQERFIEGKEWNQTEYYENILESIETGKYYWECTNKSDLDQRFQFIDSLYLKIKEEGYKPQRELLSGKTSYNLAEVMDEISINIGRTGDLLFNDGAHRLSIVKILGIEKIPIRVTVVHSEFMKKIKNRKISFQKLFS